LSMKVETNFNVIVSIVNAVFKVLYF